MSSEEKEKYREVQTKDMTITALMAALVFVGTFFLKVSSPTGYIHLGDCMILLTVCLFGWKKGAVAGAIGAGLADIAGGWVVWMVPTIFLKVMWAWVMGMVIEHVMKGRKFGWLVGAAAGAPLHILGYTVVRIFLYGKKTAILEVLPLTVQTLSGVVLCAVIYQAFKRGNVLEQLRTLNR